MNEEKLEELEKKVEDFFNKEAPTQGEITRTILYQNQIIIHYLKDLHENYLKK